MPTLPLKIDFFAMLIFLGIVQGLFLSYFFLSKKPFLWSNRFLGLLILCFSLAITEILLCYTNLMFNTLHLVDFAEPKNFLIPPLAYFYIRTRITHQFSKKDYWHFFPFVAYFIYCSLIFFPQNIYFKYNAYIHAYHPELPAIKNEMYWDYEWLFFLKNHINTITIIQLVIYLLAIFFTIKNAFKKQNLTFFSKQNAELSWCRSVFFQMMGILVLFIIVKLGFKNDLGDHILAAHLTFVIYLINFKVIRQSVFFHPHIPEEKEVKKYEKSTVTHEIQENILQKIEILMAQEKPFLQSDFSLPSLAKSLKVSPHQLSQIINETLGQNFFEFTAQYRIQEAQKLLISKEYQNIKIEEIAEMVGYNSKSSFNTSFKKIVGLTPSEFRKNQA
ncbi:MAG: helix-turn-helix domain-containing protein [Raineya sp.]|jgi:AraC-like DNA-binding protein|nr:helix-turn-helix domain-containing protein [Raineya sp.]